MPPRKFLVSTSAGSTPRRTAKPICHPKSLQPRNREGWFKSEGWRVRKDGSQFWAHVVVDPIRDPTGKLIGFGKITRDLSERKEAEEKLWHTRKLFRLLVQGVTDYAIYLLDYPRQHRQLERRRGAHRKGVSGSRDCRSAFLPFLRARGRRRRCAHGGARHRVARRRIRARGPRRRKDRSSFWAHVVIDPVYDADAGRACHSPRTVSTTSTATISRSCLRAKASRRCASRALADPNTQDLSAGDYVRIFRDGHR